MKPPLPPGQYESPDFPRFGLMQFADRFPQQVHTLRVEVGGEVGSPLTLSAEIEKLPRIEQISDFHCVTTWSHRSLAWSGFRFSDFYSSLVVPRARPDPDVRFVVFRGQDGYRVSLPLDDLLAADVLLADRLHGERLGIEHGAPLRLVAPAHYGYKNAKHLGRIELWRSERTYRPAAFRFMDHPRARVAQEERGRGVPGWLLRYLYRPLVGPARTRFRKAMDRHRES